MCGRLPLADNIAQKNLTLENCGGKITDIKQRRYGTESHGAFFAHGREKEISC